MMRSLVVPWAMLLGVGGCGSDDEKTAGLGAPPTYPVPGCEHVNHRPCDIRVERCQERLMELAACLRGSEPLPVPPVTLMTTEEFVDYLNRNIEENPPPDPNHFEIALNLVNLVAPGALAPEARVERDVEFIWGVYRHEEKDVVIVDHGAPADDREPNNVLVHEFVHVLQDADVDLPRFFEEYSTTYDSNLAVRAVCEGEARMHQARFWASLIGLDPGSIDWDEHFQNVAEFAEDDVLADPSPYLESFSTFPYELGARFVHYAWRESGRDGVDGLFASPPTRSHAVMASLASIATADWPAPDFPVLELPPPFTLWAETSLGAWGLYLRLSRRTQAGAARSFALSWRGDHFGVYVAEGTPAETVVVWRIELSNESSAIQIEELERASPANGAVYREGNRVVIARTNGTSSLDWALTP